MASYIRPRLIVHDPDAAINFYERSLGARLDGRFVGRDTVVNADLSVGEASFTLAAEVVEWGLLSPLTIGGSASLVTLGVADARETASAMVSAGAEVVVPVEDRPYGRCEGRVRDPFGHLWIPTHDLGRVVAPTVRRIVADLTSTDLTASADFYRSLLELEVVMAQERVVTLTPPNRAGTQLTVVSEDATASANPQVSIEVDDLELVWERAAQIGAEIVHPRSVESWGVERFFVRDPAGNIINILTHHVADD